MLQPHIDCFWEWRHWKEWSQQSCKELLCQKVHSGRMETICEVGSKSVNGFKQTSSLHLNQLAEVEGLCYKKKLKHVNGYIFQEFQLLVLKQIWFYWVKYLPKEKKKYFIFNWSQCFNLAENEVSQIFHQKKEKQKKWSMRKKSIVSSLDHLWFFSLSLASQRNTSLRECSV